MIICLQPMTTELSPYAGREDRPIDVLFVGGYSRHHKRRADILEKVAKLAADYNVGILSRPFTSLLSCRISNRTNHAAGKTSQARLIRMIARNGRFGCDYYELLASAKIVLNGSIDIAVEDRGNMRCFEALGARSGWHGEWPDNCDVRLNRADSDAGQRSAQKIPRIDRAFLKLATIRYRRAIQKKLNGSVSRR